MSVLQDLPGRCSRSTVFALFTVFALGMTASNAMAQISCSATPLTGCVESLRAKVLIHDDPKFDDKNKFIWSYIQGEAMSVGALGNPIQTDDYTICVYDGVGGSPALVMELQALAGSGWRAQASNGFGYSDRERTSDGLQKMRVAAGSASLSKVKVTARGVNIPIPAPYSEGIQLLEADPTVIVQMVNTTGTCWNNEFDPATARVRNNGKDFRSAY